MLRQQKQLVILYFLQNHSNFADILCTGKIFFKFPYLCILYMYLIFVNAVSFNTLLSKNVIIFNKECLLFLMKCTKILSSDQYCQFKTEVQSFSDHWSVSYDQWLK